MTLVAGALAVPQMTRDEIIASRAGMGGVEARDEISSLESVSFIPCLLNEDG